MTVYDPNNIFAKILRDEIPSHRVYEDDAVVVFMDVMPQGQGHTLVVPKAPSRNLLDADAATLGPLFQTVQKVARAVKRALLLMESSLQDKVSVNEIANRLNCSRRQLERLFATELGISPMAAYLALRVHYAKSLLEGSDLRIGEIAYRCGFGNAGHFSRVFRQQTGITPTHLRHPSRSAGIPAKR